jgi:hypothetical protein
VNDYYGVAGFVCDNFLSCDMIGNLTTSSPSFQPTIPYLTPIPTNADHTSARWHFRDIEAMYVGNDLMRCQQRANIAPANGSKCSQERTCFFGNQNCIIVGAFPATRCSCRGQESTKTWSCSSTICPKSKNEPII